MYCIISKYKLIQSISGRRCLNFLMMCIQTVVQQSRVQFPSTLFHLWSNFVQYLSLWSEKDVTNKRGRVWPIKTHQIALKLMSYILSTELRLISCQNQPVVLPQMVERYFPTPRIHGSKLAIGNFCLMPIVLKRSN